MTVLDSFLYQHILQVFDRNPNNSTSAATRKRLVDADPDLTQNERLTVREFLDAFPVED